MVAKNKDNKFSPEQYRAQMTEMVKGIIAKEREKTPTISGEALQEIETRLMERGEEKIAAMEAEFLKHSITLPGSEEETDYSHARVMIALSAKANGDPNWTRHAEKEYDISEQIRERGHGSFEDASVAFLIPEEQSTSIIEMYQDATVAFALGVQSHSATGMPWTLPVEEKTPDVDNVSENDHGDESEIAFGNLSATPKEMQSLVRISRRALSMNPQLEGFIRRKMAEAMARKTDYWVMRGQGGENEPVGVLNALGTQGVDFSGVSVTPKNVPLDLWFALRDMVGKVEDSNVMTKPATWKWAMAPKTRRACEEIRGTATADAEGQLQVNRVAVTNTGTPNVLGYGFENTNSMAVGDDTELVFADWSTVNFVRWGGMALDATNVADGAFKKRQTLFSLYQTAGMLIEQPLAIAVANGLDLSSYR